MGLPTSGELNTFDPDAYPAEIWAHIIDFVVDSPSLDSRVTDLSYRPFKETPMEERDWKVSLAQARSLSTLCQLVLVCKQWHAWLSRRLYSCLRIHHGTDALLEGLARRRNGCLAAAARSGVNGGDEEKGGVVVEEKGALQIDYASLVRVIQVHHDPVDFDPFNPVPLCDIITLCAPTIEYFIRPCLSQSGGALLQLPKILQTAQPGNSKETYIPYPFPSLPNLRRIDWYNAGSGKRHFEIPSFLAALIVASSRAEGGLESLTYSHPKIIHNPWNVNNPTSQVHTSLSLKTLRLENETDTMRLFAFNLPNLENVIISQPHRTHVTNLAVSGVGDRVKRLEVTNYPYTELVSLEDVENLWRALPNLEEINLSLRALMIFSEMYDSSQKGRGVKWANVRTLRINYGHIGVGMALTLSLSHRTPGPLVVTFLKDKLNLDVFESVVLHGSEADWVHWRTEERTGGFGLLETYFKSLPNVTFEFAS